MEVGLHELEDEVEVLVVFCADDLVQLDDVGVVEFLQQDDLAEGALRVGGMLEGIEDLLEGQRVSGLFISHFPDVAVSPAPYLFDQVVFL